jgi:hypothetical protein
MDRKEIAKSDEEREFVVVREDYLVDIVKALTNLTPSWTTKLKNGNLKLQFAVQMGSKLNQEKQLRFMEFVSDTNVPDKYMGKMLHAFALGMSDWSVHSILRIYKLAEKTKAAIVMYNNLMDEYETLFQQFEHDFLEGEFPVEQDRLERTLYDVECGFQALYNQAPTREKKDYNRFYGDSSSSSKDYYPRQGGASFPIMIGVTEDATPDEIRRQSRRLLKKLHPDRGGSAYLFDWVKKAYDAYVSHKP